MQSGRKNHIVAVIEGYKFWHQQVLGGSLGGMLFLQALLFVLLLSFPLSWTRQYVWKSGNHGEGEGEDPRENDVKNEDEETVPPVIHYHKYKGADDITTVPYLDGEVLQSFLMDYGTFFDMKRTQKCLAGKKIAVFGDSTIEDFVYDLALILSGISRNKKIMNDFIERSTQPGLDPYVKIKIPTSPMYMEFYKGRRNVTVIDPENDIYIKHRFTGHVSLKANRLGIKTFFRKEFQDELNCILGFVGVERKKECRKPDFIVMNSGLHDDKKKPDYFQDKLRALLENWKKKYKHMAEGNVEIFWRGLLEGSGNLDYPYPSGKYSFQLCSYFMWKLSKRFLFSFVLIS